MNTHLPGSKNCQDNGFDNLGNLGMGNPSTQTRSDLMDENSNLGKTLYDLNFDSFINETKVKRALNSLSPLKAAGRDGIKAKFICNQCIHLHIGATHTKPNKNSSYVSKICDVSSFINRVKQV